MFNCNEYVRIEYKQNAMQMDKPKAGLGFGNYVDVKPSDIHITFKQFLNGKINNLYIKREEMKKLEAYLNDGKKKSLENLLAASFIGIYCGATFDYEGVYAKLQADKKFLDENYKNMHSSMMLYKYIEQEPTINFASVDLEYLKRKSDNSGRESVSKKSVSEDKRLEIEKKNK